MTDAEIAAALRGLVREKVLHGWRTVEGPRGRLWTINQQAGGCVDKDRDQILEYIEATRMPHTWTVDNRRAAFEALLARMGLRE